MSTGTQFLYILQLVGGKYYIGVTNNLYQRLNAHWSGEGCDWTKVNKPLSVERVIENPPSQSENYWTKEYMMKHTIANVRGGSYSSPALFPQTIKFLESEFATSKSLCYECKEEGHVKSQCPEKGADDLCESMKKVSIEEKPKKFPENLSNHGKYWYDKEEGILRSYFEKNLSLNEIAFKLGRSEVAIFIRLEKMGLLSMSDK